MLNRCEMLGYWIYEYIQDTRSREKQILDIHKRIIHDENILPT
jgi:hypothetical protein